ncbi:deferrochelatase/peroxidase EfeB [Enterobacillus tribolii]|uniref:Deferrochelatase n=2 Tax=Enterobacillus tribolii TaxID=1487935 RepID=A0A370R2S7_9GAMM|nr:deferrochelatase/peroxidase EfeB [Enterobacillus tribolii]
MMNRNACPFHTLLEKAGLRKAEAKMQPSRRRLLMGAGVLGGALALGNATGADVGTRPLATAPGGQGARRQKQPFYGRHQAGILTPQQASMMLVAFDVLATDRAELQRLFRLLTARIAFLTGGGPAEQADDKLPPPDSGIMGPEIYPDNLTMTVSVGDSLFDERYGLAAQKPRRLQRMTRFPNDALDAAQCHGDLLLQICSNSGDSVIHALRDVIKHTPDLLSVRWRRDGFISAHAAQSAGEETPINLLGFKDGTANPDTGDDDLMAGVVWVGAGQDEPAWTHGGSYQAVRLIRFRVEFWDRTPLHEQENIFGRNKASGAPLGMTREHDVPDYARDPDGKIIPLDAHIRLANPRTPQTQSSLMLRRGYSYSQGVTASGQLDMGLLFVCYQHDLEKGFLTVQKRLNGEALEEYVKPFGGGYFFALPGVPDGEHYLGQGMFA